MKRLGASQKGFTIIELLLAIAFFSFILLFVLGGFIGINRQYTRGYTIKRVHETGRLIIEDIARSIRISNASEVIYCPSANPECASAPTVNRLCLSNVRYAWNIGDPFQTPLPPGTETFSDTGAPFTLVTSKDGGATCSGSVNSEFASGVLDETVFVRYITITPIDDNQAYEIEIVLSTDPNDTTDSGGDVTCNFVSGPSAAYCDVIRLKTTATPRT